MSNKKQSSVDILCKKLAMKLGGLAITFYIDHAEEIAEAKAMHNEEIKNSHKHGFSEGVVFGTSPIGYKYITSEDYYNETFGGNK